MKVDPSALSRRDAYAFLISSIVPRPIGWVSTVSAAGEPNLAPFSFFNGVCSEPPMLSVCVARRRGATKDTARNVAETGELVVNVVEESSADLMVRTSAEYPHGVSEFVEVGLEAEPSELVKPARVKGVPVAMECRVERVLEVGNGPTSMILARILLYHVRDDLLGDDGRIDQTRWVPMARLGGQLYAPVRETREIPRPG
jgi:flavin reductase (DIM6/NTAB) family NADH-FMN oxidoreductase RutF